MRVIHYTIFSLILFLSINTYAQKKFSTKGEAQMKVEDTWSKEETKEKVRHLAKINAIERVFGTYVEQETNINIEDGDIRFKIVGNTRVKGEWLKTKNESFREDPRQIRAEGKTITEIWITCKIEGTVREIVKPKLTFIANALNCPQAECRTAKYLDGESFYLHFKSASNGFLSLYIVEGDQVYRLLPYQEMVTPYVDAVPVQYDKEYVFFAQTSTHDYFDDFPYSRIDEIVIETALDREYLQLYVVFSREKFSKPMLNKGKVIANGSLPKSLSTKKFEEWITKNRIYNAGFNYRKLNLEIVKQ